MMDISSANLALFLTALGFSAVASYYDLRTGEIPDKFSMGLVVVALAARAAFSPFVGGLNYLLDGAVVGALFFSFGALLFYTGGWGGGDAKLIAGVGAALGGFMAPSLLDSSLTLFPPFFGFFVALSLVAIPYSLTYAMVLAFKAPRVFGLVRERLAQSWFVLALGLVMSVSLIILFKPYSLLMGLVLVLPALFYLMLVFTRSVEEVAMQKEILLEDLKEGDMVVEDIIIGGKRIASKRDMDGISEEALEELRSARDAPKQVKIKWGIKFAPAFPLALLIAPFWPAVLGLLF